MANISDLKFPIITINKAALYFARGVDDLTICNSRGLKNGFYKNLLIIDSSGNQYKVIDAKKIGTVGGLFGYNIFFEQKLRVELTFDGRCEYLELDQFKRRILKKIKTSRSFWDSDGLFESRNTFIEKAKSTQEIVERMTSDFYKKF